MKPRAQHAIDIISAIVDEHGPAAAAFWALPNTVLTLSGARGFADGVFWDGQEQNYLKAWTDEIQTSFETLRRCVPIVAHNIGPTAAAHGEKFAGYDIITKPGLSYSLAHTKLLDTAHAQQAFDATSVPEVFTVLEKALKREERFANVSTEDINHIAYGILLGYPDEAILSVMLRDNKDPFADRLIDANIRGAFYYICPEPVCGYSHSLVGNPAIRRHEELWSTILKDFYTSDFHASLRKEKAFMKKMEELGNLNDQFE